jgi:sugar diacid utilization regulator
MQSLLRMLLDEAPEHQTDAMVASCRRAMEVLPPNQRESAGRQLELLMELRGGIARYRRRSRELRELFETAGDLSSVRDVDGVLQAIVRRGRQLLNTDVAYLMLVDQDRGDTYMRVTEGTTSVGFADIRLRLGAGLGGRVAQSMAPFWTRDYVADSRYEHVIDEIVLEERLVAILGVPLKVGRRLLGVLFAADRDIRDFSQDEVSLLASLGDHAAIAIENAALFQETRDAVAALSTAKATIEESNRRLQISVELHERMMNLVVEGGSMGDLVDALVKVIGGSVIVVDDAGRVLAHADVRSSAHEDPQAGYDGLEARLREIEVPLRSTRIDEPNIAGVITPMHAGADSYGFMVFVAGDDDHVDIPTLERSANILTLLLSNQRARDEADNRVRGEVLAELLFSSAHDVEAIHRRARLLEVDLAQELVVIVILPMSGHVSRAVQSQTGIMARRHRGLVSSYVDRVVMLLPAGAQPEWPQTVADRLRQAHLEATVGASGPISDLADVANHEGRARRSAKLLQALGRVGEGVSADELGIYGLLLSEASQEQLRVFLESCLGPVRDYDAARGTALLPTLQAYFGSEANVAAAAERLFVHVNTLYQRLDRLDRLLGRGWRSGDKALELRLALRLQQFLEV